ncbi:MAG: HAMP domain-containing histidine kinase [Actinomycetota bacterium]|nr:HAMP domain-containing histidine kinase [Actinomycetota bacterium]
MTVTFAAGMLVLSALLAVLTYQLARTYLLRQRETSVLRQSYANARLVRDTVSTPGTDVPRLLASLKNPTGSDPVLHHRGEWFAASLAIGRDDLPAQLRDSVVGGEPSRQRILLDGAPKIVVGLPLPAVDGAYFEVFSLDELRHTLRILRNVLIGSTACSALGGAALGLTVSRRVLKPLAAVSEAASAVSHGQLDQRLDVGDDPDLSGLARSFNQMTEALQERVRRDARFAAAVSHELRSPLTTQVAALEVLEARRAEMPERAATALDLLAGEVRRFQRLVQDLLEISRIDAGVAELACEPVRLGDFVHEAMAKIDDVPLELDPAAADLIVRADKRRLAQVLANLVENARFHGGGAVRVCVEAAAGCVRLVVDDAGPGVPIEERERIFERFGRGRASSRGAGQGSGLGLSLVAEHVHLHAGRVWVEDRPGGGARFVVELPMAPS